MASAQLPVIDHANLVQNTISAVQAIAIVANQVIELTALEELVLEGAEFADDLAALEAIVQEGTQLGWELQSLQAQILVLFDPAGAPTTSEEYRVRQAEMSRAIFEAYRYAMQTQTLIRSAIRTVQHILGILGQVASAIGNLSVSQGLGQSQAKLEQLLVEANVTRTAYERAQSLEGAAPGVLLQGLHNINDAIFEGHPR
jgi:conjugal transfer/entry exclusion protein